MKLRIDKLSNDVNLYDSLVDLFNIDLSEIKTQSELECKIAQAMPDDCAAVCIDLLRLALKGGEI